MYNIAVISPIEEYEERLEALHVTRVAEESKDEERIPWAHKDRVGRRGQVGC